MGAGPRTTPFADFVRSHRNGWRQALIDGGEPHLLTGSTVANWKAILEWDADHWRKHHQTGVLGNCFASQDHRTFRYYDADRPFERFMSAAQATASANLTHGPLTVQGLFSLTNESARASHRRHVYCSADLDSIGPRLGEDVEGLYDLAIDPQRSFGNVWLGGSGTSAHPHYDTEHNMFSVAIGKKTFHLWDPHQSGKLHLHPSQHAGGRQSQAVFSSEETSPAVRSSKATPVELRPGDTLYVPPYYMHRVLSTGFTIGVNVWSESAEFRQLRLMQGVPLPVPASRPAAERVHLLVSFLDAIVAALPLALGEHAVAAMVRNRYVEPLLSLMLTHASMRIDAALCKPPATRALLHSTARHGDDTRAATSYSRSSGSDDRATVEQRERTMRRAAEVADVLREIHAASGVAAIVFGDYVELVSAGALGVQNVAAFLLACYPEDLS